MPGNRGWLHSKGYWRISLTFGGRVRPLQAHRIVYALAHGYWPPDGLDHTNGIPDEPPRFDRARAERNVQETGNR